MADTELIPFARFEEHRRKVEALRRKRKATPVIQERYDEDRTTVHNPDDSEPPQNITD